MNEQLSKLRARIVRSASSILGSPEFALSSSFAERHGSWELEYASQEEKGARRVVVAVTPAIVGGSISFEVTVRVVELATAQEGIVWEEGISIDTGQLDDGSYVPAVSALLRQAKVKAGGEQQRGAVATL